jgi:hypothetical protein
MMAADAFKKYVPGFKKAYIVKMGTELRLRDGRRIMGDHKLTGAESRGGALLRLYRQIGVPGRRGPRGQ